MTKILCFSNDMHDPFAMSHQLLRRALKSQPGGLDDQFDVAVYIVPWRILGAAMICGGMAFVLLRLHTALSLVGCMTFIGAASFFTWKTIMEMRVNIFSASRGVLLSQVNSIE